MEHLTQTPAANGNAHLGSKNGENKQNGQNEHRGNWTPGAPIPTDPLRWGQDFKTAARAQLGNTQLRRNVAHATHAIRSKRAQRVEEMPDWEQLRLAMSDIKARVRANLPELLEQFAANVQERGGIVHWARDGAEACEIVTELVQAKGISEVVKVKSMATQEINLNERLAARGIRAHETDLAEMIVQLGEDMPSHVVVPAVHRNRSEVREIFLAKMGQIDPEVSDEPRQLTMAARQHLRQKFLTTPVAISGANLGVADTGTLAVFESEGNGRMCLTLPQTLITVMGIEKLVPTYEDFEVIAQLLPRSATGERMNPYTSAWTGVTPGDGPQEFHLILLDNHRSEVLADPICNETLACIRCGSCLNICPVYEQVGGHAYNSVYPGPIGICLTPGLSQVGGHRDPNATLPFACSLCNACADACPAHIDLPGIIVERRRQYQEAGRARVTHPAGVLDGWNLAMGAASAVMRSGRAMKWAGRAASLGRWFSSGRSSASKGGGSGKFGPLPLPVAATWTRAHDIPAPPAQNFRDWWAQNSCELEQLRRQAKEEEK